VAAAAAAASAASTAGIGAAAASGFVTLSSAAHLSALSAPVDEDTLGSLGPSRSITSGGGFGFNSSNARMQAAARATAAAASGGQFLRRLSLEVNPVSSSSHRRAAGHPGRASVDLAAPRAAAVEPTTSSSSSAAKPDKPVSGATAGTSE
jgi:hypothetical protein